MTHRLGRCLGAAGAVAAALIWAAVTSAAPSLTSAPGDAAADYDATSASWNGLATFLKLARGDGFRAEAASEVDWDDLGPGDVLVILYPTASIDPTNVRSFVANGGKLIVGDDFGTASGIATRFGFLRDDALGVRADFYDDLPFAPIARPLAPNHPLARDVAELVTNHPSVFSGVQASDAVFGFGGDEVVVVARDNLVLLSDPSVLINGMLRFPGNVQFALNLLRYFSPEGESRGRIVVMSGDVEMTGAPTRDLRDDALGGALSGSARGLNNFFEELNDWYLNADASRVLGVVVVAVIGLLALAAVPLRRRGAPLDGSWLRAAQRTADGASPPPSRRADLQQHFDDEGFRGSYLVPASILRDSVDTRLAGLLGAPSPLSTLTTEAVLNQVEARAGRAARSALAPVCRTLQDLPGRLTDSRSGAGRSVSRKDLQRLQRAVNDFERALASDGDASADKSG